MYQRIILMLAALFISNAAFAEEVNIQLSDKSARFMYLTQASGENFGRLELEAGFLYNDKNDYLVNAGLLVRGESVSIPLIVSIGARGYYANFATYNIAAIAIGGDLLLSPESWGGGGAGVFYYTAPEIISFADAKDLTEYGIYVNFQITPQARISVGYRQIEAGIKNAAKLTMDSGAYFGLNLSF